MKAVRIVYVGPSFAGCTTSIERLMASTGRDFYFESDHAIAWPPSAPSLDVTVSRLHGVFGSVTRPEADPMVRGDLSRLERADGAVFVADSQEARWEANVEVVDRLRRFLSAAGRPPESLPLVFQLNKRDLPTALGESTLRAGLTWPGADYIPSVATKGDGVSIAFERVLLLAGAL